MIARIQKYFLLLIYVLLYFPIVTLIAYSVNDAKFSLQWHGFSWRWYQILMHDHGLWVAFLHSLILGICASLLATLIGLLACVHLFVFRNHYTRTLHNLLIILIIIPDLVLGVSLLIFFNLTAIPLGFISLLIAHTTFCLPFVMVTIYSRIQTLDPNIYFSALDLGASKIYALRTIILPLMWSAILSALLLCFTLSFDDVIISYFVAGPDFNILPLTIYSLVRAGITPEVNALCSLTIGFSIIIAFIVYPFVNKVQI